MSFDTPNGTRGAFQPRTSGPVARLMTRMMVSRTRRKHGALMGGLLVLTTIGARSGAERSTPVRAFGRPDGTWVVVASANGGARNPAWYHNLAAHPDEVRIEVAGTVLPVTARQLHGAERDEAWAAVTAEAARFAAYQTKTDRELPVIELAPRTT